MFKIHQGGGGKFMGGRGQSFDTKPSKMIIFARLNSRIISKPNDLEGTSTNSGPKGRPISQSHIHNFEPDEMCDQKEDDLTQNRRRQKMKTTTKYIQLHSHSYKSQHYTSLNTKQDSTLNNSQHYTSLNTKQHTNSTLQVRWVLK